MKLTVGNLIMAILGIGGITNNVLFHLNNGATNPFTCELGWCVVSGLIYMIMGGLILTLIGWVCVNHWNTTIKL